MMENRLPKYIVWVAVIVLIVWGFYRNASGAVEHIVDTETVGGDIQPIIIETPGLTETEIRWRDKQSAANDIEITSDCCQGQQGYTAPVKNFRPPDYYLKNSALDAVKVWYLDNVLWAGPQFGIKYFEYQRHGAGNSSTLYWNGQRVGYVRGAPNSVVIGNYRYYKGRFRFSDGWFDSEVHHEIRRERIK